MLGRNGIATIAGSIIPVLVTIVTLPFLLDVIGTERYGAIAICWLILVYVGQADWGIGRSVTFWVAKLVGEDEAAARGVVTSGIVTIAVVGVGIAAAAVFISWVFFGFFFDSGPELRAELMDSLFWIGAGTFSTSILQVLYGSLAGRQRFVVGAMANMVSNASMPLFALAAAQWVGPSVSILMIATFVGRVLGILIAAYRLWWLDLRGHPWAFSMDRARMLLQFGFWIMVSSFTSPILITIDRMIVGANLGAAAVAAYTIPYQIVSRLQIIPQSLMNVAFPRLTAGSESEAFETAMHYSVMISGMFLPVIVGLIMILDPLMVAWLGDKVDPLSIPVAYILLSAFLFTAIVQSVVVYLQSREQARFVAGFQMAQIVPYTLALWYAAIEFGLLGVAAVFLMRRVMEAAVFVSRARFGLIRFWRTQLPAALSVPAAILLEAQVSELWVRLTIGSGLALVSLAAAYLMAPASLKHVVILQLRRLIA